MTSWRNILSWDTRGITPAEDASEDTVQLFVKNFANIRALFEENRMGLLLCLHGDHQNCFQTFDTSWVRFNHRGEYHDMGDSYGDEVMCDVHGGANAWMNTEFVETFLPDLLSEVEERNDLTPHEKQTVKHMVKEIEELYHA